MHGIISSDDPTASAIAINLLGTLYYSTNSLSQLLTILRGGKAFVSGVVRRATEG